jgi:hypothetical protein
MRARSARQAASGGARAGIFWHDPAPGACRAGAGGFAAYRALETTGAESFEAYPDLAFRLWARGNEIPPKRMGTSALDARRRINERLGEQIACAGAHNIWTLDQADAAVLSLSAAAATRSGAIGVVEEPREGRFALALDRDQAAAAGIGTRLA